jgi:UDP-glucuronate 4-epimerase
MALFLFAENILKNKPINVFNHGKMIRDFTYIDDIIESIYRLIQKPASSDREWDGLNPKSATSSAPYQIFNIGNSNPASVLVYIEALENALNLKANKIFLDIQPGDVNSTYANTNRLESYINFSPKYSVSEGVNHFAKWYLDMKYL